MNDYLETPADEFKSHVLALAGLLVLIVGGFIAAMMVIL